MTYKEALEKIATVNAMDYEYQSWAREALSSEQEQRNVSEHLGAPVKWSDYESDGVHHNKPSLAKQAAHGITEEKNT